MIKMILTKILILISMLSFSVCADTVPGKDALAKQCKDLSMTVAALISSQQKSVCMDKLFAASAQLDSAGRFILEDVTSAAKQELEDSVYSLQFAELNGCNRYIQIAHSKFAAQRIKNLLNNYE